MSLSPKQQSINLNRAIELLEQADVLIQAALGACDECEQLHLRLEDLQEDLIGQLICIDEAVG